jgi:hypothetical protein
MDFELVGNLTDVETIATGSGIRGAAQAAALVWQGPLEEMKGVGRIRLKDGLIRVAELHWYEARGIGKKEFKRKKYLD